MQLCVKINRFTAIDTRAPDYIILSIGHVRLQSQVGWPGANVKLCI